MTEQEWLSSTDPAAMLKIAASNAHGRVASDRKLRLFAVACCRAVECVVAPCKHCENGKIRIGFGGRHGYGPPIDCPVCHGTGRTGGLTDPRSRRAVEMAERYADGEVAAEAIQTGTWFSQRVYEGVKDAEVERMLRLVRLVGGGLLGPEGQGVVPVSGADAGGETPVVMGAVQAALLRDIVGNPWREPSLCGKERPYRDPSGKDWYACSACKDILRWNDRTIPRMAEAIYAERAWNRMPILGDALEDAGCGDVDILNHCRGMERVIATGAAHLSTAALESGATEEEQWLPLRAPHVRGCFVLDLLLGKE